MPRPNLTTFLIAIIAALITIQLVMIGRVTFNWDELQELATLFSSESGYAVQALRKGLHYLIWPLKWLPFREDTLMVLARYWSFLTAGLGTYLLIFLIGRRLHGYRYGLLATVCGLGFVSHYETIIQFRTDAYLTLCFTWSLYLLIRAPRDRTPWLFPGLLMALAFFINPKAVYHMATLGACHAYLLAVGPHRKQILIRGLSLALVTALGFALLTWLHMRFYGLMGDAPGKEIGYSAATGFSARHGIAYKLSFVRQVVAFAFAPVLCLIIGLVREAVGAKVWLHHGRGRALVWLSAVCMLLTLTFHQGTYKYYIVSLMPPLALITAMPLYRLMLGGRRSGIFLIGVFLASILSVHMIRVPANMLDQTRFQRQMLTALEWIFPPGTPYADGVGLRARDHNVMNLFTDKKYKGYLAREQPILEPHFRKRFPAYILPSIRLPVTAFPERDQIYLREHFLPFAGDRIWVHGKRLEAAETIRLEVSGPYRLIGDLTSVTIDDRPAEPSMELAAGEHRVEGNEALTIVYGLEDPDTALGVEVLPPGRGTLELERETTLYLPPGSSVDPNRLQIEGRPFAPRRFATYPELTLSAGSHRWFNTTGQTQEPCAVGPLYERYVR